jgi:hypothetical protein
MFWFNIMLHFCSEVCQITHRNIGYLAVSKVFVGAKQSTFVVANLVFFAMM